MGYTTIQNVAGMFPTFHRGGANQKPADALIQQYIDDVAGEIDAVLKRRFATGIGVYANFATWITALPAATALWQANTAYSLNDIILDSNGNPEQAITAGTSGLTQPVWSTASGAPIPDGGVTWRNVAGDASRTLERVNRYGATVQLGETLATFGVASARELVKIFSDRYEELLNQLDARAKNGDPLPAGRYDKQFDSMARTETPRPAFQGVAGGDQDSSLTPADANMSNVFGKFDPRGT